MTLYKRALFKRIKDKYAPDEVDKLALLIIVAFLTIFSIMGCIEAYAYEREELTPSVVSNIQITPNSNAFVIDNSGSTGYVQVEVGYRYILEFGEGGPQFRRAIAYSDEIPALNVPYTFLTTINPGESYTFIPPTSDTILYFSYSPLNNAVVKVYREKLEGQESAVSDLVDNVGINQIWNVFNDGISFVGVVVLVAFGIFLVVLAIRKVSKGKSEF